MGIPISALAGDNVVRANGAHALVSRADASANISKRCRCVRKCRTKPMRFPVQYVIRPDANFRGFAGQVASGTIRPGDTVLALPSRQKTRVRSIVTYDGDEAEAFPPMSVTLTLEDEIDLSRGDMLVSPARSAARCQPTSKPWWCGSTRSRWRRGEAICSSTPCGLRAQRRTNIDFRVNMNTLEQEPASELKMNDIGAVRIRDGQPAFLRSL